MALVHSNKTNRGDLARLHNDMDELFDSFFSGLDKPFFGYRPDLGQTGKAWPALDVAEKESEFVVKAEVPGCKAEDINIAVHGSTLTIGGEKKMETEEKEKGRSDFAQTSYYHAERSYGSFRRDLNLGADIDLNRIEAQCKDGVLTITLPKAETAKAVKIKVKG